MPLKHWQVWGINHLSREPVPVFGHLLCKEMLANIQSEAALNHFHASYHWILERSGQHLPLQLPSSGSCREP